MGIMDIVPESSLKAIFARRRRSRLILEASFAGAPPAATAAATRALLIQVPTPAEEEAAVRALMASLHTPSPPARARSPQQPHRQPPPQAARAAMEVEGKSEPPSPLLIPPVPSPRPPVPAPHREKQKEASAEVEVMEPASASSSGPSSGVDMQPPAAVVEKPPKPARAPPETPASLAELGPIWMMQGGETMTQTLVGLWWKRLEAHGGSVDSAFSPGRTRLLVVPADAPGSKILEIINNASASAARHKSSSGAASASASSSAVAAAASSSSSFPSRKRSRPVPSDAGDGVELPLETLDAPGLPPIVTHKWLEEFVRRSVAAMQKALNQQQQQGAKDKGKGKRAAPVVVRIALPSLAEYVWEDPEVVAAAGAANAAAATRGQKGKKSGVAGLRNHNEHLTQHFEELSELYGMLEDHWRRFKYAWVAQRLSAWPEAIKDEETLQTFAQWRGVGKSIKNDIEDIILNYGYLPRLEKLKESEGMHARLAFQKIWGVGPKTAKALFQEHGLRTIEELRARVRHQPHLLTDCQHIGLRYYEELQQRIPRAEVEAIEARVRKAADELTPGTFTMTTCGSYRRGAANCGDVDILFGPVEGKEKVDGLLWKLVDKLTKRGFLTNSLTSTRFNTKNKSDFSESYMGICCLGQGFLHRRIDLKAYPRKQYPFAVLYFTGSDYFNRSMRCYARNVKKWSLSDKHMGPALYDSRTGVKVSDTGKAIVCNSEREIFEKLGLPYKAPEQRNTQNAEELLYGQNVTIEELQTLIVQEERREEDLDL